MAHVQKLQRNFPHNPALRLAKTRDDTHFRLKRHELTRMERHMNPYAGAETVDRMQKPRRYGVGGTKEPAVETRFGPQVSMHHLHRRAIQ